MTRPRFVRIDAWLQERGIEPGPLSEPVPYAMALGLKRIHVHPQCSQYLQIRPSRPRFERRLSALELTPELLCHACGRDPERVVLGLSGPGALSRKQYLYAALELTNRAKAFDAVLANAPSAYVGGLVRPEYLGALWMAHAEVGEYRASLLRAGEFAGLDLLTQQATRFAASQRERYEELRQSWDTPRGREVADRLAALNALPEWTWQSHGSRAPSLPSRLRVAATAAYAAWYAAQSFDALQGASSRVAPVQAGLSAYHPRPDDLYALAAIEPLDGETLGAYLTRLARQDGAECLTTLVEYWDQLLAARKPHPERLALVATAKLETEPRLGLWPLGKVLAATERFSVVRVPGRLATPKRASALPAITASVDTPPEVLHTALTLYSKASLSFDELVTAAHSALAEPLTEPG